MTDLTKAPVANDIENDDITMLVRTINGIDTLYQVPASVIRGEQGPQGIQGPDGKTGPQGEQGAGWFSGSGKPTSGINPIENDMYIDLTNYDIYKYSNSIWSLIGNIQGPQGITGKRGSLWSVGSGAPVDTGIYNSGDMYLNTDNGTVYNYTTKWNLQNNLTGPQGIQGIQGIQGVAATWYHGNGSPNITGSEGDKYLNTENSDVYSYDSGSWTLIGNFQGIQGVASTWYYGNGAPSGLTGIITNDKYIDTITDDLYSYDGTDWVKIGNIKGQQGQQGIQGIQGNVGPRGSIWRYGNVSPPTITDANLYDVYLDGITGNVYQYISGSWVSIGNIRGPVGTFTNDGSDDILISSATLYDSGSLNFYSDGDNTTIDSAIIPTGGTSGTEYKGNLTLKSDTIIVSNKFSSDNGSITTDGSGNITFSNGKKINLTPNDTTQTGISLISGNSTLEILDTKGNTGNISVKNATLTGKFSSDNGDITSDGSGNLNVKGLTIGGNNVITENTSDSRYLMLDGTNYLTTSDRFTLLKSTENTGFEMGATSGASYLDFHSDSSAWNDFDARIISWGGGSENPAFLQIIANTIEFQSSNTTFDGNINVKSKTSLDNGNITTDGNGNLTTTGLLNAKTPDLTDNSSNVATTAWVKSQKYVEENSIDIAFKATWSGSMSGNIENVTGGVILPTTNWDVIIDNGEIITNDFTNFSFNIDRPELYTFYLKSFYQFNMNKYSSYNNFTDYLRYNFYDYGVNTGGSIEGYFGPCFFNVSNIPNYYIWYNGDKIYFNSNILLTYCYIDKDNLTQLTSNTIYVSQDTIVTIGNEALSPKIPSNLDGDFSAYFEIIAVKTYRLPSSW